MRYTDATEEAYLKDTLYHVLNVKESGNSVYKSIMIKGIEGKTVHLECEPYDDAYSVDKAERVINRRRNAIFKALNVNCISAELYDEWTLVSGLLIKELNSKWQLQ